MKIDIDNIFKSINKEDRYIFKSINNDQEEKLKLAKLEAL